MRAIRIILQIVIVLAGGVALAALLYAHEFVGSIVFAGAIALLLAFTFSLKEHTESRLSPGRKISYKPMGIVLLLLGVFGIFHGLSYLAGSEVLPDGSGRCRAVCGLILLATQSFGESVGRLVAGFLWSIVGLFLCYVGYKIKDVQKAT
jgi:hypothetical protein